VRLLVIGGRARHIVVRLSRTPMTNLNLLNDRDNAERVKARCPQQEWDRAIAECELAMQAFPGSLYAGIDLMFSPGFRKHAILEVNAFGDLLPGAQSSGMDTYEAELAAKFGCPLSVPEVA